MVDAGRVVTSLDRPVGDEGDAALGDLLPTEEPGFEELHLSLHDDAVRRAVAALPEPERSVVRLRYGFDGAPQSRDRVARRLHLSSRRLHQIEQVALERLALRRELDSLGEAV